MWLDDLDVKVYITTAGDYVSLGTRTEYPFTSGGAQGVPSGWTPMDNSATNPTDVNHSVGQGRFNTSNASTTNQNAGKYYGAYRDFPVTPDNYYTVQVQARVMQDKDACQRYVKLNWQPQNGAYQGSFMTAYPDWEQISQFIGFAPGGQTSVRVGLEVASYPDQGFNTKGINWGVQFQNLALIAQPLTPPDPTWQEISCDVRSMNTRYGRDRFTSRYDVATLTIGVANDDGAFTYKPNGTLRPGRFLKVSIFQKGSSTEYAHYYGVIDSLNDAYSLDGHAISLIHCVDPTSLLSNTQMMTIGSPTSTYISGDRFRAILNASGWKIAGNQQIYQGVYVQQPILANGRTIRDELGLIADSEGGNMFADRIGQIVYRSRNWNTPEVTQVNAELLAYQLAEGETLPVVDTVPNRGTPPIICIRELQPQWSRDRVVNEVSLANQGGNAITTVDAGSQRKYGPQTYQRMDFLNDNSHPEYLTERTNDIMTGYTEAMLRVNSVQFRPTRGLYTWPLKVFLNELVRIRYQHPTEGWGFALVSHVQGIEHTFSLTDWSVMLTLDNPASFVYWETADLGTGWDIGGWDDDIWDGAADPNTNAFWDAKYPWSEPVSKWG